MWGDSEHEAVRPPFAQQDEVVVQLVEVVRALGAGLDRELVPHLVRGRLRVRVRVLG